MTNEILQRSFTTELQIGDGDERTVHGRVVPYGEIAEVGDLIEGGEPRIYREAFELGAFRGVAKAAHRVELTHEHGTAAADRIGRAVELIERDDGLYGVFRVFADRDGDHVLTLVREGVLHGMSVVARTLSAGKRRGGVVIRTACHLESVGLTSRPAYAGAEVLAVRSQLDDERPRRNADIDARLAALGLVQPD